MSKPAPKPAPKPVPDPVPQKVPHPVPQRAANPAGKPAGKPTGNPADKPATRRAVARALDLQALPGHNIRRLQQIAVAIFLQEAEPHGLTPVQYAALQAVANAPGTDQRTLAGGIGLDTSTVAGVVDRLEQRGLLQRSLSPQDRRVRLLSLTPEGHVIVRAVVPAMQRAQARVLAPLPVAQREQFLRMLQVLVSANNELSRAPRD